MTKIGNALRAMAHECDAIADLSGVLFATAGDLTVNLGYAEMRLCEGDLIITPVREELKPREGLRRLIQCALQAAEQGALKPSDGGRVEPNRGNP